MSHISVTKARENIYQLLSDVNENCQPIIITNKNGKNGVLISEQDWNAIQETLYLNSVPGLTDAIQEGMDTSLEDCIDENEVEW